MKTLLTIILTFITIVIFGQIRPDLQPADYSPEMTNEVYGLQNGSIVRYIFSSLDSLFSAGAINEITNVSDTSSISSPQLGDIAINSSNDTLMFRSTYGWLVFVGGGGGGGGSMSSWTLVADSGSNITVSDAVNVTITGAGIASTSNSGNALTITATEVDGSTSNELDTITIAGDSGSVDISDSDTLTIAGSGIASTAVSGNTVTITATEVDGSTSNEIQTIDTFSFTNNTLQASLSSDGEAAQSVTLSPSGAVVTADGTDTLDMSGALFAEKIFQLDVGSVSRSDTVVFSGGVQWGKYTAHLTNVTTDTITWPDNLLDSNGDTLGTREYTSAIANMLSFYYDGTNYYAPQVLGTSVTLPVAPDPCTGDTIQCTSGLVFYIHADSISSSPSHNTDITTWDDLSSNGYDFTQDTAGYRPTYLTNEVNGKAAVDFDGSDDYMLTSSLSYGADSITIFAVVQDTSSGSDELLLSRYNTSAAARQLMLFTNNSAAKSRYFTSDTGAGGSTGTTEMTGVDNLQAWSLVTVTSDATNGVFRKNGVDVTDTSNSAVGLETLSQPWTLAARWNSGSILSPSGMQLALLVVFDRKLTTSEINKIETYINNQYSLY